VNKAKRILAEALAILGMVSFFLEQDPPGARSLVERSLALYQKSGDQWGVALTTFMSGVVDQDLALSRFQLSLNSSKSWVIFGESGECLKSGGVICKNG
jgi:hypothetical protein